MAARQPSLEPAVLGRLGHGRRRAGGGGGPGPRGVVVTAVEDSREGVPRLRITVDDRGGVRDLNALAADRLGYAAAELARLTVYDLLHSADCARLLAQTPDPIEGWPAELRCRDGVRLPVLLSARVRDGEPDGRRLDVLCEPRGPWAMESAGAVPGPGAGARAPARRLTALAERLEALIERSRRGGAEHAVCYVDVDHFKVINQVGGLDAGDQLIDEVGALLAEVAGAEAFVVHLGADRFGVLLPDHDPHAAQVTAERILVALGRLRFRWRDADHPVAASIGVVDVNRRTESATDVHFLAELACDRAKALGRNRVCAARDLGPEIAHRREEMSRLGAVLRALEDGRFLLHGQPISPAAPRAGEPPRFELLLRMRDADGTLALPATFLRTAERYNVAVRVDRWVVGKALEWIHAHARRLPPGAAFGINLSGQSLGDAGFLRFVLDEIGRREGVAAHLCFEITETAMIERLDDARRFLASLRRLGARFALDDFGAGLSSFAYLQGLPVDYLKIDGVFVRRMLDNPVDRELVRAINDIGHLLGKRTMAEYVESRAARLALADMGVDFVQGFEIGRPRPLDELL